MKWHSIDRGTPKRYRVVCQCKYFVLSTLSGTKTQDFNPLEVRRASSPFLYGSPPGLLISWGNFALQLRDFGGLCLTVLVKDILVCLKAKLQLISEKSQFFSGLTSPIITLETDPSSLVCMHSILSIFIIIFHAPLPTEALLGTI